MATRIKLQELSRLGLYTHFDVSRWSTIHGVSSLYLEQQDRQLFGVKFEYYRTPGIVLLDSDKPGKVLKRFPLLRDVNVNDLRDTARAWVDVHYDMPMEFIFGLGAAFPAPAVDLLRDELEWLLDVEERVANPSQELRMARAASKKTERKEVRAHGSAAYN